ncbi:MAG: NHL repeat-containing protein [Actinomycetota bacterium]|nr:NHL repeat-containing protein [Actinomycetota bacterium]
MTRLRLLLASLGALLALLAVAGPALADYSYQGSFGHPGSGPGGFGPPRANYRLYRLLTSPGAIAFDGQGNVWVADSLNARVQRFSPSGRYLGGFGRKGIEPGLWLDPEGLVLSGGRLYVAMNGNDRIDAFTLGGRWTSMFVVRSNVRQTFAMTRGAGPGQLHNPYQLARSPSGSFYVADLNNGRVNRYDSKGHPRGQIGSFGSGPGQFLSPYGVAVDGAGNVYVSDRDLNRIAKFSPSGQLLVEWGETGTGAGDFRSPGGLAVDRSGNVYVADLANLRVQKFAPDGTFLDAFGAGILKNPNYVAVARDCTVYVSDYRRVARFAPRGGAC